MNYVFVVLDPEKVQQPVGRQPELEERGGELSVREKALRSGVLQAGAVQRESSGRNGQVYRTVEPGIRPERGSPEQNHIRKGEG